MVLADGMGPIIGRDVLDKYAALVNTISDVELRLWRISPRVETWVTAQIAVKKAVLSLSDLREQKCPQGHESCQGDNCENRDS